jgi:hypothetical protein
VIGCELHADGRVAVALWVSPTWDTGLCEDCLWLWFDFARAYPDFRPRDLIPLVALNVQERRAVRRRLLRSKAGRWNA